MENGIERIAGLLFSGAAVRLAGATLAIWLGLTIGGEVTSALESVAAVLEVTSKGIN